MHSFTVALLLGAVATILANPIAINEVKESAEGAEAAKWYFDDAYTEDTKREEGDAKWYFDDAYTEETK